MGVYLKGITEDDFKEISWESVYLALKRQGRIVEVPEPHGRLIDADKVVSYVPSDEAPLCKYLIATIVSSVPTVIEGSE